jgi:hypothetical protein
MRAIGDPGELGAGIAEYGFTRGPENSVGTECPKDRLES